MEQLTAKQQAEINKMSTERLRMRLAKLGLDEEIVTGLDRAALMTTFADYLLKPPPPPEAVGGAVGGMVEDELALRRQELELRKLAEERAAKEFETRQRELQMAEERAAKEYETRQQEIELKRLELRMREEEMNRQQLKDEAEKKRQESLAGQTRFYGEAMKHSLPKMGDDPSEFPAYFKAVENLYTLYEVPKKLQSKLLIPMLNERSKSLLAKLPNDQLDDYEAVRNYLLREFKLTAEQYRDRFWTAAKQSQETYTLFGSRIKNLFLYYLDSRKVTNKDDVIDLMVSDRIKQTLPDHCLRHVLSSEGSDWYKPDRLTDVVDTYMNSHLNLPRTGATGTKPSSLPQRQTQVSKVGMQQGISPGGASALNKKPVRCWRCSQLGHKEADCKLPATPKNTSQTEKRTANTTGAGATARPKANANHAQVAFNDRHVGYRPVLDIPQIRIPSAEFYAGLEAEINDVVQNISRLTRNNGSDGSHDLDWGQQLISDAGQTDDWEPCSDNTDSTDAQGNACDLLNMSDDVCTNNTSVQLSELEYCQISVENMSQPVVALKDSGAQISLVKQSLVGDLDLPKLGVVSVRGVVGQPVDAELVSLKIKLHPGDEYDNIAPPLDVMFAACDLSTDVDVILCGSVVSQLESLEAYNVLKCQMSNSSTSVNAVTTRAMSHKPPDQSLSVAVPIADEGRTEQQSLPTIDELGVIKPGASSESNACDALKAEQQADASLNKGWTWAKQGKGGYYVQNGLLYHHDRIMGQKVEQLCLPQGRRLEVCKLAHDLCHQGYKKTKEKIKMSFYWDSMNDTVKEFVDSCLECQCKARELKKDRVPITVIPRDQIPFSHLYLDIIGKLFDNAEYNYCLCIIDSCTRYPFAFPLRSPTAKAVCDCLLQVFSLVGVSKVISFDQGTCFTSELTQSFLKLFGCSPVFSTPLHPEGNSLVERLNQSVKKLLHHVCKTNPKQWHKLLPLVLWCIRESKNDTLGVSPSMMVMGRNPSNPLKIIRDSWTGENNLPVDPGKSVSDFLTELQENIKSIHDYADAHASREQHRYVAQYNKRACDKNLQVGQQVIVLLPDSTNKLMSKWQGPGTIVDMKTPHSYLIELDRGQRRWLHANKLRPYHARVNEALVNNCAIVYEDDEDFGTLPVAETIKGSEVPPSCRVDPSKLEHLTTEQKQQFLTLLDEFSDVFAERPGFCKVGMHEINVTPDFKPKRLKAYRVPELLKAEVARQLQELLDLGFIVPSNSEMASPIVCVLKHKGGQQGAPNGVRLCCDYRYLNKYTRGDAYPTPNLSDIIHRVGSASYTSCWDARSGYWQLPVKPEHRWLTAFVTDFGVFEWTRMPFGLKCASNSFIRAVQQILQPIRIFSDSYVDDLATFSDDWSSHLSHVRLFLCEIRKSGMTLKLEKCEFAKSSLTFVGHVIGSGMHGPDPDKVSCVEGMKPPTTKKEVRQILGFFGFFRSYISNFAGIAQPLTELTKKHVPNFVPWTDVHQQAFEKLKTCLCEATKLHVIAYGKPCGILVDASSTAVGSCLIQWTDNGQEKPIAFASAKLTPSQTRWSTVEREAYAAVFALRRFRNFVFGTKVTIFSDHNPLMYLKECAPKSSKLTRWSLGLQEFDITWSFKPGSENQAADCLSRLG